MTHTQFEDLAENVKIVADKMGIKDIPTITVLDTHIPNSSYSKSGNELVFTTTLIELLDTRELRAVIGHELGHSIDSHDSNIKIKTGTVAYETSADVHSVKEWGDPEALESALRKMDNYYKDHKISDRDIIAYTQGNVGTWLYDHTTLVGKEVMMLAAKQQIRLHESADPHPDDNVRFNDIINVEKIGSQAITGRETLHKQLDAIEETAKRLETGQSKDPDRDMHYIMSVVHMPDISATTPFSLEQSKIIAKEILNETPQIRSEEIGHNLDVIKGILKNNILHTQENDSLHKAHDAVDKLNIKGLFSQLYVNNTDNSKRQTDAGHQQSGGYYPYKPKVEGIQIHKKLENHR